MRFYVKCTANRVSSTGCIFLAQHIDKFYSATKYIPIVTDGFDEYGFIEGTGDVLSKTMNSCKYDFSMERLFEEEFVGACVAFFNERINPMTKEVEETLKQMLDKHSITYQEDGDNVDQVYHIRKFKTKLFKEITKNKFNDYNDLIANMSKILLLLNEYNSELTESQQTRFNVCMSSMKSIYDAETCLGALEEDITKMSSVMPSYYTAKNQITNVLTTVEDILDYQYE